MTTHNITLSQFAVSMYLLTYVGAIMNGLTILTLAWAAAFSLPRVYRDNQKQIDEVYLINYIISIHSISSVEKCVTN